MISVIPFVMSFKTIGLIHGWYFYIPVVWIMYVNWLAFSKSWMVNLGSPSSSDMQFHEDTKLHAIQYFFTSFLLIGINSHIEFLLTRCQPAANRLATGRDYALST